MFPESPLYLRQIVNARHSIYRTLLDAYLLGLVQEDAVRRAWLAVEAAEAKLESVEMRPYHDSLTRKEMN